MIDETKNKIDRIQYRIEQTKEKKKSLEKDIDDYNEKLDNIDAAIGILTTVLAMTQEGVTKFVEDTVATALQYVYSDDYGFRIKYELKRNQPEVLLTPTRGGIEYDPKFSCGVGVIDICSFALRYSLWALMPERSSSVMIHDEPFRHISGAEQLERAGVMVKRMSEMLGIQIIMVSGKSALIENADKIFEVKLEDGISEIR